jgi:Protein of unknown function (DUF998)
VPPRLAAVCGLIAPITAALGWALGALAQPDAYSSADDDLSDLGALTASSAWIYNQIGANLTGLLVIAFALGLWRVLSPDVLGRVGAGVLVVAGTTVFLGGLFRLDCRGIDMGCENESWHAAAHKWDSRVTIGATIAAPLVLAFAFRRLPEWRHVWLPTLAAMPASVVVGVLFSAIGAGASTRASTAVWLLWLAFLAFQLLRKSGPSAATVAA